MTDKTMSAIDLSDAQRRAVLNLTPEPQAAKRGGAWSPIAAFNLVLPGYVELHQSYTGDRYSLTERGMALRASLENGHG